MKQALLLVDLQNDYFPGGKMELTGSNAAVEKASLLLDRYRREKLAVIHVKHISLQPESGFFLVNSKGAEINEKVAPLESETIITKHYPNSFRETGLLKKLKDEGIEKLTICGAMSHMCIDATVRAAFDLGFQCLVAHDACATKDLEFETTKVDAALVHASFMAALSAVYAEVVLTSDLL